MPKLPSLDHAQSVSIKRAVDEALDTLTEAAASSFPQDRLPAVEAEIASAASRWAARMASKHEGAEHGHQDTIVEILIPRTPKPDGGNGVR